MMYLYILYLCIVMSVGMIGVLLLEGIRSGRIDAERLKEEIKRILNDKE